MGRNQPQYLLLAPTNPSFVFHIPHLDVIWAAFLCHEVSAVESPDHGLKPLKPSIKISLFSFNGLCTSWLIFIL